MSVYTDNASRFATDQPHAIDMERRATITLAVQLLVDGMPGRARYELARSVMRQARMAGVGSVDLGRVCPCGRSRREGGGRRG